LHNNKGTTAASVNIYLSDKKQAIFYFLSALQAGHPSYSFKYSDLHTGQIVVFLFVTEQGLQKSGEKHFFFNSISQCGHSHLFCFI
jgi:hypothetical protein